MNKKVWFIQMLRGIASLSVVYNHIFALFFANEATINQFLHIDKYKLPPFTSNNIFLYIFNILDQKFYINPGFVGVYIFFLISGFVIPISIENNTLKKFIISRLFRIYPVAIIGMSISILSIYISQLIFKNTIYHLEPISIISNFTILLRYPLHQEFIDPVLWTLGIEIYFYILLAIVYKINFMKNIKFISIILAIVCMIIDKHYSSIIKNIMFMLIGTSIFLRNTNKISKINNAINIAFIFILIQVLWYITDIHYFNLILFTTLYSFLLFIILYKLKSNIKYSNILDFFGNISYPMYISHQILGYALLSFLILHINMYIAIIITFIIIITFAYIIHITIEKPSILIKNKVFNLTIQK